MLPSWSIASLAPALVLAYPAAQAFELTWYTKSWSGSTFIKNQKTEHVTLKCTTVQQSTKKSSPGHMCQALFGGDELLVAW